jgi:hypothetical protein
MTPTLTQKERDKFKKDIEGLKEILAGILLFSKDNLVKFNGRRTENYTAYFLNIFTRFRINTEGLLNLMDPFYKDYRLKICTNLLLRSICSDILTALYLLTFYDKDDKDNISLKNELNLISSEYLRYVKRTMEEDHDLLLQLKIPSPQTIEEKRNWINSIAHDILDEKGNIKSRDQIRATTKPDIKKELKNNGTFLTEEEKFQRIKNKGFADYRFVFIAFKYYSQFQHFTLMSKKYYEFPPSIDTYYMALTLDHMLMVSDIILQLSKSPNPNFRTEISKIRDKIVMHFA